MEAFSQNAERIFFSPTAVTDVFHSSAHAMTIYATRPIVLPTLDVTGGPSVATTQQTGLLLGYKP